MNVSSRVVGYYESDERSPDKETLVLIADFFDVSLDYLLCRSDIKNSSHLKKIKNSDVVNELLELEEDNINQMREYLQLLKLKEYMNKN
ncbi:MAG: helix-turn-helix transcriptional regulator [Peptostreptococcaceae bacterium]